MSAVTFTQANPFSSEAGSVGPGRVLDLLRASLGNFRTALSYDAKTRPSFTEF